MKKVSTGIKKVTIDSPVFSGEVFEQIGRASCRERV